MVPHNFRHEAICIILNLCYPALSVGKSEEYHPAVEPYYWEVSIRVEMFSKHQGLSPLAEAELLGRCLAFAAKMAKERADRIAKWHGTGWEKINGKWEKMNKVNTVTEIYEARLHPNGVGTAGNPNFFLNTHN